MNSKWTATVATMRTVSLKLHILRSWRDIYTALDGVGAPFCVYFTEGPDRADNKSTAKPNFIQNMMKEIHRTC